MAQAEDSTEAVARQMERAALFLNGELTKAYHHIEQLSTFLYGLADVVLSAGIGDEEQLMAATVKVGLERASNHERAVPAASLRYDADGPDAGAEARVDCASRMHLCRAACCTLEFALSAEEVEAGSAKFDLGRPYFIRREASGYCTHNSRPSGGCTIYADRPAPCRSYSCQHDSRIWLDFDNMVVNEEFLQDRFSQVDRPVLLTSTRHRGAPASRGTEESEPEPEPPPGPRKPRRTQEKPKAPGKPGRAKAPGAR